MRIRSSLHVALTFAAAAITAACSSAGDAPNQSTRNAAATETATPVNDTYSEELRNYIESLAGSGSTPRTSWRRENVNSGITMFGCAGAQDGSGCFADARYTSITDARSNAPNQTMKVVRDLPYTTSYWVRSSADGRYTGASEHIMDHFAVANGWVNPDIPVAAPFDPYFFPGNDGFTYAGVAAGSNDGIVACKQSILADMSNDELGEVTFKEAGCAKVSTNVYQSVGRALNGGSEYVVANSPAYHVNDPGQGQINAAFGAEANSDFVPMVLSSTGAYDPKPAVRVNHPNEGDLMLSPTGGLYASRLSDGSKQTGYRVGLIETQRPSGSSTGYSFATRAVATIDLLGGKPTFSYDERFLAVHSYKTQNDPHLSINSKSSDIVIVDLKTGSHYQVTKMPQNVKALYPHFRNDGWLYFLVRDGNTQKESLWATDLAARIARGG